MTSKLLVFIISILVVAVALRLRDFYGSVDIGSIKARIKEKLRQEEELLIHDFRTMRSTKDKYLPFLISDEDKKFYRKFQQKTLAFKEWTHRAHLRLAYLVLLDHLEVHLSLHPVKKRKGSIHYDGAFKLIKKLIKGYNRVHEDKLTMGWHVTLTSFWLKLVGNRLLAEWNKAHVGLGIEKTEKRITFEEFLNLYPEITKFSYTFEQYNKETIFSDLARNEYVPPDKRLTKQNSTQS